VAPSIGENEGAPGACEYHCTVGTAQCSGIEASASNVALLGAVTVRLAGCSTIDGAAGQVKPLVAEAVNER
jgi:hypothetical protein